MQTLHSPGEVLPLYAIVECAAVYGTGEVFRDKGGTPLPQTHRVPPGLHRGGLPPAPSFQAKALAFDVSSWDKNYRGLSTVKSRRHANPTPSLNPLCSPTVELRSYDVLLI